MFKPTVKYKMGSAHPAPYGGMFVFPIDHTSPFVSNTKVVMTSKVVSPIDEDGRFETINTIYIPEIGEES